MAALPVDASDIDLITSIELLIKQAMTEGIASGLTDGALIEPPSGYTPAASPSAPKAPTSARDAHRCIAAGIVQILRQRPTRLPTYTVATVPPASGWAGAAIYVSDGASGQPMVAFSSGSAWLRSDTGNPIST